MPRGDRTGPAGAGAMSGRGVGYCRGSDIPPRYANSSIPCRMGMQGKLGRMHAGGIMTGRRGRRWGWIASPSQFTEDNTDRTAKPREPAPVVERQFLENRYRVFHAELEAITRRLEEIDAEEKTT